MEEEKYYKPEEVMKLLSISKATLNRRAENGTIPSELEEGRKRGRKYPKEAIDTHVKLLKPKEKAKLTFGPSTNSDLWAGYQNSKKLYDEEDIVSYETLLEWREHNHDIFMTAKEGDKRAGGITMIPISESTIHAIMHEKIREKDIPLWDIRKWTDSQLSVYIPSISITHTGNIKRDRERGAFIIRNAIKWAYTLQKRYDIKSWYAIAATEEGEKLVKHIGFQKIEGKRDAYILQNTQQVNKLMVAFLDKLEEIEEIPINPERKPRSIAHTQV